VQECHWQHVRVPCSAWIPILRDVGQRRKVFGNLRGDLSHLQRAKRNTPCSRRSCGNSNSTPHA